MTRCAHCKKRIRENHQHVGLMLGPGTELAYHAREACRGRAFQVVMEASVKGGVFGIHHYHTCGDEASGFDCYAGCFREEMLN